MNNLIDITTARQTAVTLAYLAYAGETLEKPLPGDQSIDESIAKMINYTIPKLSVLQDAQQQANWRIVWGPVSYTFELTQLQDNMMYVAQSISKPSEYVVAIRGTNGTAIWDWIEEDFRVLEKEKWKLPAGKKAQGTPKISKATDIGLDALLNKMIPASGMPGAGLSLGDFLSSITDKAVEITFTGHSLAGAISEAAGLWFRQTQSLPDHWDPQGNANVKVVSFAGATTGDSDFTYYFNQELGENCQRIHNTHDVVPHGWEKETLKQLPELYSSIGIKMDFKQKIVLDIVIALVSDYRQVQTPSAFTWPLDPKQKSYIDQAGVQHRDSYISALKVENPSKVFHKYPGNNS
ncbi:MAG: hypothetical protein ACI910_000303 [Oleispira sp.]|jgi:hypothetical protein